MNRELRMPWAALLPQRARSLGAALLALLLAATLLPCAALAEAPALDGEWYVAQLYDGFSWYIGEPALSLGELPERFVRWSGLVDPTFIPLSDGAILMAERSERGWLWLALQVEEPDQGGWVCHSLLDETTARRIRFDGDAVIPVGDGTAMLYGVIMGTMLQRFLADGDPEQRVICHGDDVIHLRYTDEQVYYGYPYGVASVLFVRADMLEEAMNP